MPNSRSIDVDKTTATASISLLSILFFVTAVAEAADEFEQAPISYSKSAPDNVVSRLQSRLNDDKTALKYDRKTGYLKSLLKTLKVPVESQMLVFSKTSMQRSRISPRTPRAIYFNDDVYVGYCQTGNVLEISAVDPKLGTVFYTLDQSETKTPRFSRNNSNCLVCHAGSRTGHIPGHLVRSLYVGRSGHPIFSAGSHTVDQTTPLKDRWGGWYVTGTHGQQTHLGNLVIDGREVREPVDNKKGQNVTSLAGRFDVKEYLSPHSDITALMVLEHQTLVHNRITKAGFAARQALHYEAEINKSLGEPAGTRRESTTSRISGAGDKLVESLLMVDEAKLTAPLKGTSGFARVFTKRGPRDKQGRSLRDLDLKTRLFKYPCSYLIYSRAFDELPKDMRDYVWRRLWQVLVKNRDSKKFAHLTTEDKRAIVAIIRATKRGLPDYWKSRKK